jgi:hypothetical protein
MNNDQCTSKGSGLNKLPAWRKFHLIAASSYHVNQRFPYDGQYYELEGYIPL